MATAPRSLRCTQSREPARGTMKRKSRLIESQPALETIMSNTPGISPITPDIEEIRHSDRNERDLLGDEQADDPAMDDLKPESGEIDGEDETTARIERSTLDLA
ncbi:hypothetical protein [Aureimonas sp. AU12]|uniref:hypothetical protein n=1 Tax=Aureimonas sp. AU12 TaxID=1638161 RepID=UPI00078041B3|nr:hypothetical protein [Aureimonas sp. AU12]